MAVQPQGSTPQLARFLIWPNSSLSWRGNQIVFVTICVLSFSIAGAYALLGFWLILPFAGVEMLALGIVLYHCAARAGRWEMVAISADTVEISSGRRIIEQRCIFQRHWACVIVHPAAVKGRPDQLLIRSHGREVEIGACLVNAERHELAQALKRAL